MNTSNTIKICSNLEKILQEYGNINYITKNDLYLLIDYIRECFKIEPKPPFNILKFYENFNNIIVCEEHEFKDSRIGGFLVKNKFPELSHIVINKSKEPASIIFDLTHEIMHFLLHPEDREYYISTTLCNFENFEWQANEGAAELLVPYKIFIPKFVEKIKFCRSKIDYIDLLNYLTKEFIVSTAVLEYRIEGLKYEIYQYENGIPIENIELLSHKMQQDKNIWIASYNDIFSFKPRESLKSIINAFYNC